MTGNNSSLKHLSLFGILFFIFSMAYQASSDTIVDTIVIDKATVMPSTVIINFISPSTHAVANEHKIVSDQANLSVLNGCEGTEMLFLLVAAILAFPGSFKRKAIGLILGTLFVYALNQVRIVVLYFSLLRSENMFAAIHGYIGPLVIIMFISVYFLWWIKWASPKSD